MERELASRAAVCIITVEMNNQQRDNKAAADLGRRGELFALEYLKHRAGYRIVATNVQIPIGRTRQGAPIVGEIDIIGYDGDVLAFVEVKARTMTDITRPEAAVDRRKQRILARTARAYRRLLRLTAVPYRFDTIAVVFGGGTSPEIILYKGSFTDATFGQRPPACFYDE